MLLTLALQVSIIDAHHQNHHNHHQHRCGCDSCKSLYPIEKPREATSQNPETEPPTMTSVSTNPAFGKESPKCYVIYQQPICRKGKCTKKDLGIYCCCGNDTTVAKPLKDPKDKCHTEFKNQDCAAISVTCNGCDDHNNCKCKIRKAPSAEANISVNASKEELPGKFLILIFLFLRSILLWRWHDSIPRSPASIPGYGRSRKKITKKQSYNVEAEKIINNLVN